MSNIELPRDAEGREVPLDTKVMYYKDGSEHKVLSFTFSWLDNLWRVLVADDATHYNTNYVYLNPPDNWAKLEEDLDRCIERGSTCMYFSKDGSCRNCTVYDDMSRCNVSAVFEDIKKRIRNLNGENHDC